MQNANMNVNKAKGKYWILLKMLSFMSKLKIDKKGFTNL